MNGTLSISSAWMRRQECAWLQLLWQDSRPRGAPEKPQIFWGAAAVFYLILPTWLKPCNILRNRVLLLLLCVCQNHLHQSHLAAKSANIVEVADKFLGFAAVGRILCLWNPLLSHLGQPQGLVHSPLLPPVLPAQLIKGSLHVLRVLLHQPGQLAAPPQGGLRKQSQLIHVPPQLPSRHLIVWPWTIWNCSRVQSHLGNSVLCNRVSLFLHSFWNQKFTFTFKD